MTRDFLALAEAGADAVAAMLADALDRKAARKGLPKGAADPDAPLAGRVLAAIFEKSSTRTRVSFDMAMRQLGGTTIVMDAGSMQLGRGETIADTARVLSRYVDAIVLRTDDHAKLTELARHADVPVINGLTDHSHPCQIMADMLTVLDATGRLAGTRWAWLGDGNNVANSLVEAGNVMKFAVTLACPEGHEPDAATVAAGTARVVRDPDAAVAGADVVVTDTWVSMGQADDAAKKAAMAPFAVTEAVMAQAAPGALFLHCLPAHRGEEVDDAVLDGPASLAWEAAENRLHAQKSVLLWCFGLIG